MLQILMESQYKTGETLSDDTITGLLLALLFAGQHTSGITATWTGFFLAQNPQYAKEVIQEMDDLKKEFGETISFDSLKKADKVENAVRESLRMFPPLILLMRKVKVPLKYKNYDIPVGDIVAVAPGYGMRLESVYENADTWNPHRLEKDDKPAYSYIAFGGGRHGCPGENFGVLQNKAIWTVLLRNFEFEIPDGKLPVPDYTNLVIGPKQPALIRYRRRKDATL